MGTVPLCNAPAVPGSPIWSSGGNREEVGPGWREEGGMWFLLGKMGRGVRRNRGLVVLRLLGVWSQSGLHLE